MVRHRSKKNALSQRGESSSLRNESTSHQSSTRRNRGSDSTNESLTNDESSNTVEASLNESTTFVHVPISTHRVEYTTRRHPFGLSGSSYQGSSRQNRRRRNNSSLGTTTRSMRASGSPPPSVRPLALTPGTEEDDEEDPCSICLDKRSNEAAILYCMHRYCFSCIKRWAEGSNNTCPLCKMIFNEIAYNIRSDRDYDVYKIKPRRSNYTTRHTIFSGLGEDHFNTVRTATSLGLGVTSHGRPEHSHLQLQMARQLAMFEMRNMRGENMSTARVILYQSDRRTDVPIPQLVVGGPHPHPTANDFVTNQMLINRLMPFIFRELCVVFGFNGNTRDLIIGDIRNAVREFNCLSESFARHVRQSFSARVGVRQIYPPHYVDIFIDELRSFIINNQEVEDFDRLPPTIMQPARRRRYTPTAGLDYHLNLHNEMSDLRRRPTYREGRSSGHASRSDIFLRRWYGENSSSSTSDNNGAPEDLSIPNLIEARELSNEEDSILQGTFFLPRPPPRLTLQRVPEDSGAHVRQYRSREPSRISSLVSGQVSNSNNSTSQSSRHPADSNRNSSLTSNTWSNLAHENLRERMRLMDSTPDITISNFLSGRSQALNFSPSVTRETNESSLSHGPVIPISQSEGFSSSRRVCDLRTSIPPPTLPPPPLPIRMDQQQILGLGIGSSIAAYTPPPVPRMFSNIYRPSQSLASLVFTGTSSGANETAVAASNLAAEWHSTPPPSQILNIHCSSAGERAGADVSTSQSSARTRDLPSSLSQPNISQTYSVRDNRDLMSQEEFDFTEPYLSSPLYESSNETPEADTSRRSAWPCSPPLLSPVYTLATAGSSVGNATVPGEGGSDSQQPSEPSTSHDAQAPTTSDAPEAGTDSPANDNAASLPQKLEASTILNDFANDASVMPSTSAATTEPVRSPIPIIEISSDDEDDGDSSDELPPLAARRQTRRRSQNRTSGGTNDDDCVILGQSVEIHLSSNSEDEDRHYRSLPNTYPRPSSSTAQEANREQPSTAGDDQNPWRPWQGQLVDGSAGGPSVPQLIAYKKQRASSASESSDDDAELGRPHVSTSSSSSSTDSTLEARGVENRLECGSSVYIHSHQGRMDLRRQKRRIRRHRRKCMERSRRRRLSKPFLPSAVYVPPYSSLATANQSNTQIQNDSTSAGNQASRPTESQEATTSVDLAGTSENSQEVRGPVTSGRSEPVIGSTNRSGAASGPDPLLSLGVAQSTAAAPQREKSPLVLTTQLIDQVLGVNDQAFSSDNPMDEEACNTSKTKESTLKLSSWYALPIDLETVSSSDQSERSTEGSAKPNAETSSKEECGKQPEAASGLDRCAETGEIRTFTSSLRGGQPVRIRPRLWKKEILSKVQKNDCIDITDDEDDIKACAEDEKNRKPNDVSETKTEAPPAAPEGVSPLNGVSRPILNNLKVRDAQDKRGRRTLSFKRSPTGAKIPVRLAMGPKDSVQSRMASLPELKSKCLKREFPKWRQRPKREPFVDLVSSDNEASSVVSKKPKKDVVVEPVKRKMRAGFQDESAEIVVLTDEEEQKRVAGAPSTSGRRVPSPTLAGDDCGGASKPEEESRRNSLRDLEFVYPRTMDEFYRSVRGEAVNSTVQREGSCAAQTDRNMTKRLSLDGLTDKIDDNMAETINKKMRLSADDLPTATSRPRPSLGSQADADRLREIVELMDIEFNELCAKSKSINNTLGRADGIEEMEVDYLSDIENRRDGPRNPRSPFNGSQVESMDIELPLADDAQLEKGSGDSHAALGGQRESSSKMPESAPSTAGLASRSTGIATSSRGEKGRCVDSAVSSISQKASARVSLFSDGAGLGSRDTSKQPNKESSRPPAIDRSQSVLHRPERLPILRRRCRSFDDYDVNAPPESVSFAKDVVDTPKRSVECQVADLTSSDACHCQRKSDVCITTRCTQTEESMSTLPLRKESGLDSSSPASTVSSTSTALSMNTASTVSSSGMCPPTLLSVSQQSLLSAPSGSCTLKLDPTFAQRGMQDQAVDASSNGLVCHSSVSVGESSEGVVNRPVDPVCVGSTTSVE